MCAAAAFAVTPVWSAFRSPPKPLVKIVKAPPARTADRDAAFRFRTTSRAATSACKLDGRAYRPCRTRVKFTGLRIGGHKFTVRARLRGTTRFVSHRWTIRRPASAAVIPGASMPSNPAANAPASGTEGAAGPVGPGFGVTPTTDPATGTPAPGARLIFADEFDGATLDENLWSLYDSPGHTGNGLRRPSAFSLDGQGSLVVTAKTVNGTTVSGGMAGRRQFAYGRVEFRVKAEPDPTGTMSAVVLTWPQKQRSPEFTENDMYETGSIVNNTSRFETYIHFGVQNWQKWTTHMVDPSQWHTIAMDWKPDLLEIYVDGHVAFSISDPAVIPDILHHVTIQLDAMFPRPLARPVRMWVDYMRVYQ